MFPLALALLGRSSVYYFDVVVELFPPLRKALHDIHEELHFS
jgi:hypothetical protein